MKIRDYFTFVRPSSNLEGALLDVANLQGDYIQILDKNSPVKEPKANPNNITYIELQKEDVLVRFDGVLFYIAEISHPLSVTGTHNSVLRAKGQEVPPIVLKYLMEPYGRTTTHRFIHRNQEILSRDIDMLPGDANAKLPQHNSKAVNLVISTQEIINKTREKLKLLHKLQDVVLYRMSRNQPINKEKDELKVTS